MPKKRKPSVPLVPLTGKQRSFLRSLAHKLKPVVQIGHQGLTEGLIAAVETALERHELIKIKVTGEAEVDAHEIAPQLEKATHSQVAQIIGHTVVLYRRRAEKPKIVLPTNKPAKALKSKPAARSPEPRIDDDDDGDDDLDDDDDFDDEEDEEDDQDELE